MYKVVKEKGGWSDFEIGSVCDMFVMITGQTKGCEERWLFLFQTNDPMVFPISILHSNSDFFPAVNRGYAPWRTHQMR